MEIRVLHEEDYDETLIKWWSDNGFPAPAQETPYLITERAVLWFTSGMLIFVLDSYTKRIQRLLGVSSL